MMSVSNPFQLDGRFALITGGSRGLGRVFAETLAQAGASIVIVSRDEERCRSVAQELEQCFKRPMYAFGCDVAREDQVNALFRAVDSSVPHVDILINSAGLNRRNPIADLQVEDWDDVVDANLKAPFLMARKFGPPMAERGWGRIIHLGSILSAIGIPGRTPYAASKAGLLGLTRTLALEWATRNVTVNALCPGPFKTDMNLELTRDPVRFQEFVQKIPMGRWGELTELTGPILFLASEASSYMTGQTLFIDGGWTAQ
ncbi:MAG: SDR family NAD(P)-dependent oxidoreductase [Planctomycetota bacterium]